MKAGCAVFLIFLAGIAYSARAQSFPVPDLVSLDAPSSPSPGEEFTVRAVTPTADKNFMRFDWEVDGKARPDFSGLGKDTIRLTAGVVGSFINVSVSTSRTGSAQGTASVSLPVADLSLTWVAKTYTPKWYRGKALPTQGSQILIAAVPKFVIRGKAVPPEQLIYRWRGENQIPIDSGVGKQTVTIETSEFAESTSFVAVAVEDAEKKIRKEAGIYVSDVQPRAVMYSLLPLGGVEPRSARSFMKSAGQGTFDFIVEPFFFAIRSLRELSYRWRVDGQKAEGAPEHPEILTLDIQNQPGREIPISATINDANQFTPSASANLILSIPEQ
jgi:hypothetical protein